MPQPPNPPETTDEEAYTAWLRPLVLPICSDAPSVEHFTGWRARGEQVTPEPAALVANRDLLSPLAPSFPLAKPRDDLQAWLDANEPAAGSPVPADPPKMYGDKIDAEYVDGVVDSENVILMRELIYVLWDAVHYPAIPEEPAR